MLNFHLLLLIVGMLRHINVGFLQALNRTVKYSAIQIFSEDLFSRMDITSIETKSCIPAVSAISPTGTRLHTFHLDLHVTIFRTGCSRIAECSV